eukprot:6203084-Pleurochrysis_carterae.AAC.1
MICRLLPIPDGSNSGRDARELERQHRLRLEREPLSERTGKCAEARGKRTLAAVSPYYERENIRFCSLGQR